MNLTVEEYIRRCGTAADVHLHYVYDYTSTDRVFWEEKLEPWLPARIIDAHTHIMHPRFRLRPMTDSMRRQYWVNEVGEPIDAAAAEHCHQTVFPNREVSCIALGKPSLDFDLDGGNAYLQEESARRGWHSLVVTRPQWTQEKIKEREPADIEATYTLYMYEDIFAIKQACSELGLTDRRQIEMIFHDNAARLIDSVLAYKAKLLQEG